MDFSHAPRVASRSGTPTHPAAVSVATQKESIQRRGSWRRKLPPIRVLLGFGVVFCVAHASGQISLVNVTACGPGTFPGTVCTIPATGAGHLIVAGLQVGSGAVITTTISSITDNAGNVYAEAAGARAVDAAAGSVVDIWYAKGSVAGATAISINPSASVANAGVVIWEFAGADVNAPLDQAGALNSQGSSASPAGAAVTTTSASEVIVGLTAVAGNVTGVYAGNSFASDSALKGNGWAHLYPSTAGTYAPQWVQNPAGTYTAGTAAFKAAGSGGGLNACDLNGDGVVNLADAELAVNMSLGEAPCTANIDGWDVCNVVIVQRVVNAATGGTCVTGNSHTVSLTWTASTSPNIAGYNVFRGSITGGPYTQLNTSPAPSVTYTDSNVVAGQTYYYVTTAIDTSNNQSVYSNEAPAAVPSP